MHATATFYIKRFDPVLATDQELHKRLALEDVLQQERDPDATAAPLAYRMRMIRKNGRSSQRRFETWLAWTADEQCIGIAWVAKVHHEDAPADEQLALMFLLGTHPDYRHLGIARALLKEVASYADQIGYPLIEPVWDSPSIRRKARFFSARYAMNFNTQRLRLKNLSWELMQRWVYEGQRFSGASIQLLQDQVPEHLLDSFLALWQSAQPGSQQIDPSNLRQQWRAQEAARQQAGERWLGYVLTDAQGQVTGLLDAVYNPKAHKVILLRKCLCIPEGRDMGYRRWLCAQMFFFVRQHLPQVEYVNFRLPTPENALTQAPAIVSDTHLKLRTKEVLMRLA